MLQLLNGANEGADGGGKRALFFRRDPSFPSLQALDENGLSPELQRRSANGAAGVQPTSLQENRTMLFTVNKHTHTHTNITTNINILILDECEAASAAPDYFPATPR